jgi:hypothetical protein
MITGAYFVDVIMTSFQQCFVNLPTQGFFVTSDLETDKEDESAQVINTDSAEQFVDAVF